MMMAVVIRIPRSPATLSSFVIAFMLLANVKGVAPLLARADVETEVEP